MHVNILYRADKKEKPSSSNSSSNKGKVIFVIYQSKQDVFFALEKSENDKPENHK